MMYQLNQELTVEIRKKKIKNLNLRVLSDCKIICSAPQKLTDDRIIDFIKRKQNWILEKIDKYTKLKSIKSFDILKNGGSVQILGHDYKVNFIKSENFKIETNDLNINIFTKNVENLAYIQNKYNAYIKKQMESDFQKLIDKFYPIVKIYNVEKPKLKIRKMQACWGNCNRERQTITLNEFLYKASPLCIEYVVLHELTHFLYPYHDKNFYNFVEIHMPDWQERKNILNQNYAV